MGSYVSALTRLCRGFPPKCRQLGLHSLRFRCLQKPSQINSQIYFSAKNASPGREILSPSLGIDFPDLANVSSALGSLCRHLGTHCRSLGKRCRGPSSISPCLETRGRVPEASCRPLRKTCQSQVFVSPGLGNESPTSGNKSSCLGQWSPTLGI